MFRKIEIRMVPISDTPILRLTELLNLSKHDDRAFINPNGTQNTEHGTLNTALSISSLRKSFGDNEVLKGVNLYVNEGESIVIMGRSGAGKSVLIKHIIGLLKADQGNVEVLGQDIARLKEADLQKLRMDVGYLFQGGALFDSMSVDDNLKFILTRSTTLNGQEIETRIAKVLRWVDLELMEDRFPDELSGGQQKRVALARSLILNPKLMLYDEPTTGLDPATVRQVSRRIIRLRDEFGISSLTITHDIACAEILGDRIYIIDDGKIVESGTLEEVKNSKQAAAIDAFGGISTT